MSTAAKPNSKNLEAAASVDVGHLRELAERQKAELGGHGSAVPVAEVDEQSGGSE